MARIRSIHPGFCTSLDIAELDHVVQLHFVRLWTHCDDHGRCLDDPRLIKAACWPLDDTVDVKRTEDFMKVLQATNHVVRYAVDGRSYAQIVNWDVYQKPQHPKTSKIPPPEAGTALPPANMTPSGSCHENIMKVSEVEVTGLGEGEGEGEGEGVISRRPKTAPAKRRPRDPVWDGLDECFGPPLNDTERAKRNSAAKLLRQALDAKAVPEEQQHTAIVQLRDAYLAKFTTACTPHALASNVGTLIDHIQGRNQAAHEPAGYGVVG